MSDYAERFLELNRDLLLGFSDIQADIVAALIDGAAEPERIIGGRRAAKA